MDGGKEKRSAILGSRPDRAVPVGTTIRAMIERQARNPSTVTYNLEMTVLQLLGGRDALERITKEGIVDENPVNGFEYLMVLIRIKYFPKARGLPDYEPYRIDERQFRAVSGDGNREFELPRVKQQPDPGLAGKVVDINETIEGWIVLQVPQDEKEPLLSFDRDYTEDRLTLRTARGLLWFKLYNFDPMNISYPCVECCRPGS